MQSNRSASIRLEKNVMAFSERRYDPWKLKNKKKSYRRLTNANQSQFDMVSFSISTANTGEAEALFSFQPVFAIFTAIMIDHWSRTRIYYNLLCTLFLWVMLSMLSTHEITIACSGWNAACMTMLHIQKTKTPKKLVKMYANSAKMIAVPAKQRQHSRA